MANIEGKIALVTGSSRGIGAAIAIAFSEAGARVVVHGRDAAALAEVRARLARSGGEPLVVTGDVTRAADIERMRAQIEDALGPLDILVANAGASLAKPGPLEEVDEGAWRATIDANLTSTFLTIKSFLPGMKSRRAGAIVTMSSSAARRPHPNAPIAYAAAKAGIQVLTQDLAAQVGPYGIRINCIAPDTILTERNRERIPADVQKTLIADHPIRRLGTPEDVARAVLYLVSDEAAWISGVILDVAGGAVAS